MEVVLYQSHLYCHIRRRSSLVFSACNFNVSTNNFTTKSMTNCPESRMRSSSFKLTPIFVFEPNAWNRRKSSTLTTVAAGGGVPLPPLDLTEDNVREVLADARVEFGQVFDTSVGITGQVELAELDGPFVKISLRGGFWHKRSTVLARIGNYLKQRIPEILEVHIEDEKQLDDSPENF
ncbi:hypothetical protein K2173_021625 [Erythroxylum novogranatense]|uniref:Uncharacterized protein n=1 Tax=Erythroxylum novogranatense TaxID=1862640 RepID=A0AAV8TNC5_9ROSI|nr:hypothetical protein K2173_021625 [Erythroxylum novogranatense]